VSGVTIVGVSSVQLATMNRRRTKINDNFMGTIPDDGAVISYVCDITRLEKHDSVTSGFSKLKNKFNDKQGKFQ